MMLLAFVVTCVCSAWTLLGLVSLLRVRRRTAGACATGDDGAAVTVLKPLCGADAELEANLESFFVQDHPHLQLVFGVVSADDPAVAVVHELMDRHPEIAARLVVHAGGQGVNPKVDNLLGMLPHAEHDLLLISDSNVRAPREYVSEMVATLTAHPDAGLVTNLFAGHGEDGLGSALENVQLNGFCAAGAALPTLVGDALVVGKSMLMSRAIFERLGGFARVKDVLAEDFVIGKTFQHGGLSVHIAPTVLHNITAGTTVAGCFRRHQRWAMLRAKLRPWAQLCEVLTSPLAMLPVAWLWLGPVALAWATGLMLLRDVGGWIALRGSGRAWIPALLSVPRELMMLAAWARAPLKRHVTWRGQRVRVGAGTLVYLPAASRAR